MTISFAVSKNFYKELARINESIQRIATASNLYFLESEFMFLNGYLIGLQQLMYTDQLDLIGIQNEVFEIKRVRYEELVNADVDEHTRWFGKCNVESECVVVEEDK